MRKRHEFPGVAKDAATLARLTKEVDDASLHLMCAARRAAGATSTKLAAALDLVTEVRRELAELNAKGTGNGS